MRGPRLAASSFVLAVAGAAFVLVWPLYAAFGPTILMVFAGCTARTERRPVCRAGYNLPSTKEGVYAEVVATRNA